MARSPIYSTQTNLTWTETWLKDDRTAKDIRNPDTTNSVITLRILYPDGSSHVGTGAVTYVNLQAGRFNYKVVPGDFPAPALPSDPHIVYTCQYVVTYNNGLIDDGDFFQISMLKAI